MSRFLSKNCDNPHEEARRRREVKCTFFFTLKMDDAELCTPSHFYRIKFNILLFDSLRSKIF